MARDINMMSPSNGRQLKEDNSVVNVAEKIEAMAAALNISTSALRDALTGSGADAKTLADLATLLESIKAGVPLTGRTTTKTATIANAASLSGEIDLESYQYIGIAMPATWTAANLTFQVASASGGAFQDLYDDAGFEVNVTAIQGKSISIDVNSLKLAPWRYIKIRSGTSGTPVAQGAERTLTLVLKN